MRTTRSLLRSENTYTYSRETEKEDIRDTQTTDRFEMEKEASSMISESLSLSANLTVMAKYGEVASVSASAGFTSNTAHEQSNRDVVRSSKEVTEHVRQRMVERVKEERITKILKEFEETNTHSLEATNGNTVGVFRWLDKVYLATLRNYGKRMTFEFNIPEPAAFHLWAMTGADNGLGAMALTEPIHPKDVTSLLGIYDANTPFATNNPLKPLVTFEDITEINYKYWAAAYGVTAEVPPEKKLSITRTLLRKDFTGGSGLRAKNTSVSRIEGYHLVQLVVTSDAENNFQFFVNGIGFEINDGYDSNRNITFPTTTPPTTTVYNLLAPKSTSPDDQEAIALGCRCYLGFNDDFILQVIFIYERSEKMLNDWKIKTFKAIMDAYENKLAAYKNALEEAKAVSRNERHMGTNPLMNEQIIRSELKKLCIYSFVHKAFFADDQNSTWDTENVTDMSFWNIWDGADGFPMYNLSCDERDKFRRERMRFLEDAFDWDLLVSEFLPYYYAYGKTAHWKQLYQLTDTDPLFLNFLQAGLARVRVPVKVGMEAAALRFWETEGQEIPRGNEVYHFANDFLQHLYADIQAPIKDVVVHDAHAEGDVPQDLNSWTIRVPTTLTILQKESEGVDQNNLLCSCARTVPALPMPWIETGSVHYARCLGANVYHARQHATRRRRHHLLPSHRSALGVLWLVGLYLCHYPTCTDDVAFRSRQNGTR